MSTEPLRPGGLPSHIDRRLTEARDHVRRGRRPLRSRTDPTVFALYEILSVRRQGGADAVRALNRRNQNLVRALEIYESLNVVLKSKLEAYLLTDLPVEAIASRVSETAAVVEAYAAAFFAVREQTAAVTISLAEIADAYKDAPHETVVRQYIWKRAAIVGGADALEALINGPQPTTVEEATAAAAAEAKVLASFKIADATKSLSENPCGS
jgi:hypothetical protein